MFVVGANLLHAEYVLDAAELYTLLMRLPAPMGVLNPTNKDQRVPLGGYHAANMIELLNSVNHEFDVDTGFGFHRCALITRYGHAGCSHVVEGECAGVIFH